MSRPAKYVHVILPLALNGYTYAVPLHLQDKVQVGCLVRVPLGKNRFYMGVVSELPTQVDATIQYKFIDALVYDVPVVSALQLQLWKWIGTYYCCAMGEVLKAALPSLLLHGTYAPQKEVYIRRGEGQVSIKRAQQIALMQRFETLLERGEVKKTELLDGQSLSALQTLIKHGVLEYYEKETSRIKSQPPQMAMPTLSDAQQVAKQEIDAAFEQKDKVLLHGVTASGKTEIYLQQIREVVERGGQVLYLVPEIALTAHLANRLRKVLGGIMIEYHSQASDTVRAEVYTQLQQNKNIKVVLGTRSSVFLPFTNLQLVIVDEEHETSYKQYDPTPRYHAKNVALMLAHFAGAKTLLGSATPAVETYAQVQQGKYGCVSLTERYGQTLLPEIKLIDRQDAFKKNRMKDMFSWYLLEKIQETLEAGEQVILFQNRRGFSSHVACQSCGFVHKCPHCDVSLTYHKKSSRLACHYCGYTMDVPTACPSCGAEGLKDKGFGTEKVIEALQKYFPAAKAERLDVDAVQSRKSYEGILERFASGETQILVGTQMVAKGLDFDKVGLVGILNADNMINFPDFRATERAFQLMVQVAGRAGRREKQGMVVLQTTQLDHYVLPAVVAQDYAAFYQKELQERADFQYPPFVRLIEIQVKHAQFDKADAVARQLAQGLQQSLGISLLDPGAAMVSRVNNKYVRQLTLKLKGAATNERIKLMKWVNGLKKNHPQVQISIDVDPV